MRKKWTIRKCQRLRGCSSSSEGPNWIELPVEIMRIVFGRLSYFDQICCRSVCKSWRDVPPAPALHQDFLPRMFLLCHDDTRLSMSKELRSWWMKGDKRMVGPIMFDPWKQKVYPLIKRREFGSRSSRIVAFDSRKGWLLMGKEASNLHPNLFQGFALFLYSPFRDQMMNLPSLYVPGKVATISFAPPVDHDSSIIQVFALSIFHRHIYEDYYSKHRCQSEITVGTCQAVVLDEADVATASSYCNWTMEPEAIFNPAFETELSLQSVVYLKGTFYCLFQDLVLAGFEVSTRLWRWLGPRPVEPCTPSWRWPAGGMFEFDGKLVVKDGLCRNCVIFDFDTGGWRPSTRDDDVDFVRFQCSTNKTSFYALGSYNLPRPAKDSTFGTDGAFEAFSKYPTPRLLSTRAPFYDKLYSLCSHFSVWIRPT
ncbi:unnamed protein product [Linum trigynum]|uniref:F-box domain-containing protein n=1 Tax=Linum trigynum TaxID=586398 RepID=A0AAV2GAP0_9ROSI